MKNEELVRLCPECGESIPEKDKHEICKACRKERRRTKRKEWWDKHGTLVAFLGIGAGIVAAGVALSKAGISLGDSEEAEDDGYPEEFELKKTEIKQLLWEDKMMPKYKVILYFPDGTEQESEDIFDTEEEAIEYGNNACSDYSTGAEILHMSNPGDYPLEDGDEMDYEIIEIDD